MNEETPRTELPQLSAEELQHLLREGDPPLTRRELRMRLRAEEAGLLTRVDGELVIADPAPAPLPEPPASEEPPLVTSADVLAGNVPAASGLTRRQLREIAAQELAQGSEHTDAGDDDTGELEETLESTPPVKDLAEAEQPAPVTPQRISTRVVASELDEQHIPKPPGAPGSHSSRRPAVHPEGARTGEYTGEFDQIRQAMADINAAPDEFEVDSSATAGGVPARRSVFEAAVPGELAGADGDGDSPLEDTNAADWSAVIEAPVVTDDLLPELEPVEPAVPEADAPGTGAYSPKPDEESAVPDWHTVTSTPLVQSEPVGESRALAHAAAEPERSSPPLWLTLLQWLVIAVVAVVLGLLVWYAINRGFGGGAEEAAGIVSPLYHLRI